jgi:hypothetical protein
MRILSPLERTILSSHPDELRGNVLALLHLAQPGNADFLAEYQATWVDAIAARRVPSPCSSSPSSSSSCLSS